MQLWKIIAIPIHQVITSLHCKNYVGTRKLSRCWKENYNNGRTTEILIHCWWGCKLIWTFFENCLAIPSKAECMCALWTSISTSRCISKRAEDVCPSKHIYKNVLSSCIHNCIKLQTTQMLINSRMDCDIFI